MNEYTERDILRFLNRYGRLIKFLEQERGFGQYVITIHGKRPTKIARIENDVLLEESVLTNLVDG